MPEFHAHLIFDSEIQDRKEKLVALLKKLNPICSSISEPETKKKCENAVTNASMAPLVIADIILDKNSSVGERAAYAVRFLANLVLWLKEIPSNTDGIVEQIIDVIADFVKVYLDKSAWGFTAKVAKSSNRYLITIPAHYKHIAEVLHGKLVYVLLTPYE